MIGSKPVLWDSPTEFLDILGQGETSFEFHKDA